MTSVHFGWAFSSNGMQRAVALKRVRAGVPRASDLEAALRQEALLGFQIRHPNVIPVVDFVGIGGVTFLVMDYLPGRTLASLLEKHEPPSIATSVAIIGGVLRGLHAAHTATDAQGSPLNIIHRDVSPQNILVGVDGIARVLDFGVAKTRDSAPTRIGHVKGKIGYFAPEQFFQEPLDARTDVFAAGIVLWEALTGRRLFQRRDPLEDVADLATHQLRPATDFNPLVPKRLAAVLAQALHPFREQRFDDAEQFVEALEDAVRPSSPSEVARYVARCRTPSPRVERLRSVPIPARSKAPAPQRGLSGAADEPTPLRAVSAGARPALDSEDPTVVQVRPTAPAGEPVGQPAAPPAPRAAGVPRVPRGSSTWQRAGGALLLLAICAGVIAQVLSPKTTTFARRLWSRPHPVTPAPTLAAASLTLAPPHLSPEPTPTTSTALSVRNDDAPPQSPAPVETPGGSATLPPLPRTEAAGGASTPTAPRSKRMRAGPRSKTTSGCRPAYRYDERGIKRMKLHCL